MKKRVLLVVTVLAMCFALTGCKSSDYKDAMEKQKAGEYKAALKLYKGISGYKDSDKLAKDCQQMIDAIEHYDSAKKEVHSKNKDF